MNQGEPAPGGDAGKAPAFNPEAFGKYYLIDRIAMGGMAEIFRAKSFGVGGFENLLVIKRILSHLSVNDQFVRMFMDEAKVSAVLQAANIVRIYDFGKIRENYFIAMECVEGKDVKLLLRKLAERRSLLPREFAVYIAMEAAKGLDYAHKRTAISGQPLNIVHRDVSPSNILVSYTGEVKVADFGIVKAANCAEDTDAGMLKGKFEYMSPEQANGADIDRRSDIFALGIILHEMLTGRRLFKTDSELKTLERVKRVDVDPPSASNPAVPARLDEIVMRALAREPDQRYQDARELHADLLDFLYPASPDLTQQSLAHFMRGLFVDEMETERARTESGSALARQMHDSAADMDLEPEFDGGRTPTHAAPLLPAKAPSRAPALVGVVGWNATHVPEVQTVTNEVKPTTGAIGVSLTPAATVSLDGQVVGSGTVVNIRDLAPGDHVLRVESVGFVPHEERVSVEAGDKVRLTIALQPVKAEPVSNGARPNNQPPPRVVPTQAAPSVAAPAAPIAVVATFSSTPSGADVLVDGRSVGKTPMSWDGGTAGSRYSIELRLAGYDSAKFSAGLPEGGGRVSYERTLQEKPSGTGKVNINVAGVPWADIYINGKKIGQTPKFNYPLPVGQYTVQVKNETAGLDQTKTVTVTAGGTSPVAFTAK
jgi:serine/threonine protein kinase